MTYQPNNLVQIKREVEKLSLQLAQIKEEKDSVSGELNHERQLLSDERLSRKLERESHLSVLGQLMSDREKIKKEIEDFLRKKDVAVDEAAAGRLLVGATNEKYLYLQDLIGRSREELHSLEKSIQATEDSLSEWETKKTAMEKEREAYSRQKISLLAELRGLNQTISKKQALINKWEEQERLIDRREKTMAAMLARLDREWLKYYKQLPHKPDGIS